MRSLFLNCCLISRILHHLSSRGRIVRRARMRRLKISNAFFVLIIAILFPVYPVFGAVLYNISGGIQNFSIDTASIINDEYDKEDSQFISADIPLEMDHNWSNRRESILYTIQDGDTLGQLARDFGVSRDTIRWVNGLSSDILRIGRKLIIPPGNGYVYTSQEGDTIESVARKYTTTVSEILKIILIFLTRLPRDCSFILLGWKLLL